MLIFAKLWGFLRNTLYHSHHIRREASEPRAVDPLYLHTSYRLRLECNAPIVKAYFKLHLKHAIRSIGVEI